MAQDLYVYPGTSTLRNRYGVRDPAELARRETAASTVRLAELAARPIPGSYDLAHLQAFHRRIFGDVYDWAGEIRTVSIAKGDLFALPEHIESYLGGVLAQLAAEQHLRSLERDPFIDRLTHYLAEINATHPFREGNGRTQRAFLQQLAQDAGYRIDWPTLDPQENIDASRTAHRGDNQPLRATLAQRITTPEQDEITRLLSAASPQPPRPLSRRVRQQHQRAPHLSTPGPRRDARTERRNAETAGRSLTGEAVKIH